VYNQCRENYTEDVAMEAFIVLNDNISKEDFTHKLCERSLDEKMTRTVMGKEYRLRKAENLCTLTYTGIPSVIATLYHLPDGEYLLDGMIYRNGMGHDTSELMPEDLCTVFDDAGSIQPIIEKYWGKKTWQRTVKPAIERVEGRR
jgi:hypothetical protein